MKKALILLSLAVMPFAFSCAKQSNHGQAVASNQAEAQPVDNQSNFTIKTIPTNVHGEAIMQAIADKYKGKVVLFDFWATWCGPCRMAMKQVDEIKPELMKKGCVFVYVTGETSPEKTWKEMITRIDGDHYRLTGQQWSELCQSLNIPGIPAYLLLNKKGEKVYDNLSQGGYPGSEILKNNIEVALTE